MSSGIINILKPPGMTSHDVVSYIRRLYGIKRVGHAGTLDPAAAGVLPVAVGQATRLIEYMTNADKSYRAELTLGYETDTGDDTGKIIRTAPVTMPDAGRIQTVLSSFTGQIQQIPPMYSAIKVDGTKMYELARAGVTVERQARTVVIENIDLIMVTSNSILFDVTCSKGTYIRTLCSDIGAKLSYPAVMSFLVRTRVGSFSLADSLTLEEIAQQPEKALLSPDHALDYMPKVLLSQSKSLAFKNGQSVEYEAPYQILLRIYDDQNVFIGIGQRSSISSLVAPVKVLSLH